VCFYSAQYLLIPLTPNYESSLLSFDAKPHGSLLNHVYCLVSRVIPPDMPDMRVQVPLPVFLRPMEICVQVPLPLTLLPMEIHVKHLCASPTPSYFATHGDTCKASVCKSHSQLLHYPWRYMLSYFTTYGDTCTASVCKACLQ
jgi:hypothetical protein